MTARQYKRLVGQMPPPDMEKYHQKRLEVGDEIFYSGAHTMSQGILYFNLMIDLVYCNAFYYNHSNIYRNT